VIRLPLSKGHVALIDDRDRYLARFKWTARVAENGRVYAYRNIWEGGKVVASLSLHEAILGPEADHVDRNGLDCRRKNLRKATRSLNLANRIRNKNNSSGYKGVTWLKRERRWRAAITRNYQTIYIGAFHAVTDAALAYDAAARWLFGEFARVNFPQRGERGAR